jgi:hypothetical protein
VSVGRLGLLGPASSVPGRAAWALERRVVAGLNDFLDAGA